MENISSSLSFCLQSPSSLSPRVWDPELAINKTKRKKPLQPPSVSEGLCLESFAIMPPVLLWRVCAHTRAEPLCAEPRPAAWTPPTFLESGAETGREGRAVGRGKGGWGAVQVQLQNKALFFFFLSSQKTL